MRFVQGKQEERHAYCMQQEVLERGHSRLADLRDVQGVRWAGGEVSSWTPWHNSKRKIGFLPLSAAILLKSKFLEKPSLGFT